METFKAFGNPQVTQDHNHPADIDASVVEKCWQDMKQKSRDTNQMLSFVATTIPDEAKAGMPSSDTAKLFSVVDEKPSDLKINNLSRIWTSLLFIDDSKHDAWC